MDWSFALRCAATLAPSVSSVFLHILAERTFGESPRAMHRKAVQRSRAVLEIYSQSEKLLGEAVQRAEAEPASVRIELSTVLLPSLSSATVMGSSRGGGGSGSARGAAVAALGLTRSLSSLAPLQHAASAVHHRISAGLTTPGATPRHSMSARLTALSTPRVTPRRAFSARLGEGHYARRVYITGCREHSFINGEYVLDQECNNRPRYKSEHLYLLHDNDGDWVLKRDGSSVTQLVQAMVTDPALDPLDICGPWRIGTPHTGFSASVGMAVVRAETTFIRCQRFITEVHKRFRGCQWSATIRRTSLVESSVAAIAAATPLGLATTSIQISFRGEYGADFGGLTREWFDLLGKELVAGHTLVSTPHLASHAARHASAQLAELWAPAADGMLLPKPGGNEKLQFYVVIGRLLAMSLLQAAVGNGVVFGLPLSILVYKVLLKRPVTAEDLRRLDPDFYRQRLERLLLPGGAETLAKLLGEPLTFVSAGTAWRPDPIPLVEDGENRTVTNANKHQYVVLLCEDYLIGGIRPELAAIADAFWEIIPREAMSASRFDEWDLQRLVMGTSTVDFEELRKVTQFSESASQLVVWLFEIAAELGEEQQAKLLQFATGSSRLPPDGPAGLRPPFSVQVHPGMSTEQLPTAHTCANNITAPAYETREALRDKLLLALENDAGFGFD
eukprot:NODE_1865_length_2351_cov_5.450989.p1 GENE.NODE_1865_length_2351_cov_5.450989~~NODE_1865_length_2351_cov_5.450989.p1  ORF type:complete len:675 (+),score=166.71 NODE_1865_length_2351_cov_5.450989:97-2121(+)